MVQLDNMQELLLWNSRGYMFQKNYFLYSFILFWFVFRAERIVYCQKECQKAEVWHLTAFVVHNHIDAICQVLGVWGPNTFNTWWLKLVAFQRQHFCEHHTSDSNTFIVIWGQQSSFKHLNYSVISVFMYQGDKHVKHCLYKQGGSHFHEAV